MATKLNPNALQDKAIEEAKLSQEVQDKLNAFKPAFEIEALTDDIDYIQLDAPNVPTYQTCNIITKTNITVNSDKSTTGKTGRECYLLIHNTGSSDCTITPGTDVIAPSDIKVAAGKYIELSWIYINEDNAILTASDNMG